MDISIIITAYNYARYIKSCVNSCLQQQDTKLEYEVIIIDDGSTDDTQQVLSDLDDSRVKSFALSNGGIELASNHGFEIARGDFVVRVDADDLLSSNFLSTIEPVLDLNFGFCYSDYEIIDEFGMIKANMCLPSFSAEEIFSRGDFLATGTVYPAELLRSVGGYDSRTKNSGLENYELILKLIKMGFSGKHVSQPLFQYRRHSTNISTIRKHRIIEHGRKLFALNQFGPYRTNQYHPYKLILDVEP